jgi:hypothetical protein
MKCSWRGEGRYTFIMDVTVACLGSVAASSLLKRDAIHEIVSAKAVEYYGPFLLACDRIVKHMEDAKKRSAIKVRVCAAAR